MKKNTTILISLTLLIQNVNLAQKIKPNLHLSKGISGIGCTSCTVDNENDAIDTDDSSFTYFNTSSSILGGYAFSEYEWDTNLTLNDFITITMSFEGIPILNSIISDQVFNQIEIELLDNSGNLLESFNSSNQPSIELLDNSTNKFEVKIINPNSLTRRIKIKGGSLISLLNENIRLYDINAQLRNYIFAERNTTIGSGFSGGLLSLCVGCSINNPELATSSYDPNFQYANFSIPIGVGILASEFLLAEYDWSNIAYSGLDNDLYIIAEKPSFVNVSTDLFDEDEMEVIVNYSDGTSEVFNSSSGIVSADVLYQGSGRFYVKINLNDTKSIESTEIRLYKPSISASVDNNLNILTIFLSDSDPINPLSIQSCILMSEVTEDYTIELFSHACNNNNPSRIERSNDGINWELLSTININDGKMKYYDLNPLKGNNYYRINNNNNISNTTREFILLNEVVIYPNPSQGILNLNTPYKEFEVKIYSLDGTLMKKMKNITKINLNNCSKGVYILEVTHDDSVQIKKVMLN